MKNTKRIITICLSLNLTFSSLSAKDIIQLCLAPAGCSETNLFLETALNGGEVMAGVAQDIHPDYDLAFEFYSEGDYLGAATAAFDISDLEIFWQDCTAQFLFAAIYGKVNRTLLPVRAQYLKKRGIEGGVYGAELAIKHINNALGLIDDSHESWGTIHRKLVDEYQALSELKTDSKERIILLNKALNCLPAAEYNDFTTGSRTTKTLFIRIALAYEYFNLGNEHYDNNRFRQSADAYIKAIRTAEVNVDLKKEFPLGVYYMLLGKTLLNVEKYADAAKALETALKYTIVNSFAYVTILTDLTKARFLSDDVHGLLSTINKIVHCYTIYDIRNKKEGIFVLELAVANACYYGGMAVFKTRDRKIILKTQKIFNQAADLFARNGKTLQMTEAIENAKKITALVEKLDKESTLKNSAISLPAPMPKSILLNRKRPRSRAAASL